MPHKAKASSASRHARDGKTAAGRRAEAKAVTGPDDALGASPLRALDRGSVEHYLDAPLYDFEYVDRTADITWYGELAKERARGRPLIELGAGTGRITLPLVHAGHEVIAIDRAETMLARLADKVDPESAHRLHVHLADMTALPVASASVSLVIAPFNVLLHLYTSRDLLRCFREVYRVLLPGGTFGFDVSLPDLDWLTWDPTRRHAVTPFRHPVTQERLVYSTNHVYDPDTQICHIRIYYDDAPPVGRRFVAPKVTRRIVHLTQRQIFPEEVRLLLATTGFELESHTADFHGGPLRAKSESQVVVGRRPGA